MMDQSTTLNPMPVHIHRNGKEVKALIIEHDGHIQIEIGKTLLTIDKEDLIFKRRE